MPELNTTSVITIRRRQMLAEITSGARTTMPHIVKIALGTGGVGEDGEPLTPPETQAALNQQVAVYDIDSVTHPAEDKTVNRYTVTVGEEALVGEKISEMALIDDEGEAHAIKNMYPKQKDAGVKFVFEFGDKF